MTNEPAQQHCHKHPLRVCAALLALLTSACFGGATGEPMSTGGSESEALKRCVELPSSVKWQEIHLIGSVGQQYLPTDMLRVELTGSIHRPAVCMQDSFAEGSVTMSVRLSDAADQPLFQVSQTLALEGETLVLESVIDGAGEFVPHGWIWESETVVKRARLMLGFSRESLNEGAPPSVVLELDLVQDGQERTVMLESTGE